MAWALPVHRQKCVLLKLARHACRGDPAPLVAAEHAHVGGRAPERAVWQAARAVPTVGSTTVLGFRAQDCML